MDELTVKDPGVEKVEEWEEDFLDELGEENWLGRPEYTVELHLLDGTRKPEAGSMDLLEDKTSELTLYAFFADVHPRAKREQPSSFYRKLERLNEQFEDQVMDMDVYLNSFYDIVPEVSTTDQGMREVVLSGLHMNFDSANRIEEAMMRSEDYNTICANVSAENSARDALGAYQGLQTSASIEIQFEYTGDEEAYRQYQEHEAVLDNRYDGIPGSVYVDGSSTFVEMFLPEEVGFDAGEVEDWVLDQF